MIILDNLVLRKFGVNWPFNNSLISTGNLSEYSFSIYWPGFKIYFSFLLIKYQDLQVNFGVKTKFKNNLLSIKWWFIKIKEPNIF